MATVLKTVSVSTTAEKLLDPAPHDRDVTLTVSAVGGSIASAAIGNPAEGAFLRDATTRFTLARDTPLYYLAASGTQAVSVIATEIPDGTRVINGGMR